ncbi:MAG: hypothetical protein IPI79_01655 [Moraxellaceae bacterium]|nr:hypothetical protein [Moraxellaceae bacterium]
MFSLNTEEAKDVLKKLIKIAESHRSDSSSLLGVLSENLLNITERDYHNFLGVLDENIITTKNYDGISLKIALRDDDDLKKMEYANVLFYIYLREWQFRKKASFDIEINKFCKELTKLRPQLSEQTQYLFEFYDELPFHVLQDEFHSEHVTKIIKVIQSTDVEKVDKFINGYEGVVNKIDNWEQELPNTIQKLITYAKISKSKNCF